MPELPEVETTRRGIAPHVQGATVTQVIVRQPKLRWPVPEAIQQLSGHTIQSVQRRAKYILLHSDIGSALVHLGMSGSLRVCPATTPVEKHEHADIVFGKQVLRLRDPRRFGALLWTTEDVSQHPLLLKLGPEPLEPVFNTAYLFQRAENKKQSIKQFIMDAHVVVGVGNIYANEALFMAGIDPRRAAGMVSEQEYEVLVSAIKQVLQQAIQQGGTTLRDFVSAEGQSGYFQVALQVYGRKGEACMRCDAEVQQIRQGQRSTWYCPNCQL